MSKNKDRRLEHKKQKKGLTFHEKKMLKKAIESIQADEASK